MRAPSARSIRHVILTHTIREIHSASRGVYGARRVHAELTLGRGLTLWHGTVSMLMGRSQGHRGAPRCVTASCAGRRRHGRRRPNQQGPGPRLGGCRPDDHPISQVPSTRAAPASSAT